MDFGVVLQTDPPAWRVVELARRAETLGFTYGWTFDSHVLWQEPYVIYSQILSETNRMIVGPMVTNPGTRDWTVTASLFATLNDMFGNRTVCGIGRGDSAMRVIGRKPRSLATLSEAMRVIKDLAEGRETCYNDTQQHFPWAGESELKVLMAAYGPKALHLCGSETGRLHPAAGRSDDRAVDHRRRPPGRRGGGPRSRQPVHLRRRARICGR